MGDMKLQVDQLEELINSWDINEEDVHLSSSDYESRNEEKSKHASLSLNISRKWAQRAKDNWEKNAEKNSKYLHQLASFKYNCNNINCLNISGNLCYDKEKIATEATNFYTSLFMEDFPIRPSFDNIEFPSISLQESISLEKPFSKEQVKNIIWHFGLNKAHGPDGFTMEFFKAAWEVIKSDLILVIKEFETRCSLAWGVNCTNLKLLSKTNGAISLNNFKPISLIGGIHKILSKLLVERLRVVFPSIITNFQGAFIHAENDLLSGFQVATNGTTVNHLQFADDLIVFLYDSEEQITALKNILFAFQLVIGLKVNFSKSAVIGIGDDNNEALCTSVFGCQLVDFPINYLGIPLGIVKSLENIMRRFLWGSSDTSKKRSWVAWSKANISKTNGGIGIKKLKLVNKALHCKWIWRYGKEKDALWRKLIFEKFGGNPLSFFPNNNSKPIKHSLWAGILKARDYVKDNSTLTVHNGNNILFCFDFKRDLKEAEVGEIAHLTQLLDGFAQTIHSCMAEDTRKWDFGDEFSVSNCYSSLDVDGFLYFPHKQIWNPKISLKVSFLVWTLCRDGAPTLDTLLRAGLVNDRQYILCSAEEETQNHLFLQCPETRKLWNYFLESFGVKCVFQRL
ncbi:uncharacterized protein LOC113296197 [Papaver somniferum]|uniref:uncharacterized protein LOC113296197 n=1 Tax=Papaver somniferum TaxID=3469 RepID=UPI000E6F5871|nr:uncharacterized protein LOC113296197 [Papaver somniferum]